MRENRPTQSIYLLNRLDAPASGIVLLSLNKTVAKAVRACFTRHTVTKQYYAWVKGHVPQTASLWRDRLQTRHEHGHVRSCRTPGTGKTAITTVRVERYRDTVSRGTPSTLLSLRPQTGRTHQLRVQCAVRGYPILGDKTYGDFDLNHTLRQAGLGQRLLLHHATLALHFQYHDQSVTFQAHAPLPPIFNNLPANRKSSDISDPRFPVSDAP